jgi:hypothetical protein
MHAAEPQSKTQPFSTASPPGQSSGKPPAVARTDGIPSKTLPAVASRVSPAEAALRVVWIGDCLIEGETASNVLAAARQLWGVGRRMAQLYLQKARQRLAGQGARQSRLFHYTLAQEQRDRLFNRLMQCLRANSNLSPKELATLVGVAQNLLDSRDHAARRLHDFLDQTTTIEELPSGTTEPGERNDQPVSVHCAITMEHRKSDSTKRIGMEVGGDAECAGAASTAPAPKPPAVALPKTSA